jgi:beta-xylosidase
MNLDALVTQGRLPWSPNPDADDLDIWHQYDYPRIGTFTVKDTTVLFTLVGGSADELSVWAYVCLEDDEAVSAASATFESLSELRQFVDDAFTGRRPVLALADDLLITSWSVPEDNGELYEVATTFLEQVLAQTRSRLDSGARFRAKLAQVDVATHELMEA